MRNLFAPSALSKVLLLVLLTILLALPLARIGGLVEERGGSRDEARQALALSHAGPQRIVGPLMVVPYQERWTEVQLDERGQVKARVDRQRLGHHVVFPEKMHLRGRLLPQERYRGIFSVPFYTLDGQLEGRFPAVDVALLPRRQKDSSIEVQPARLAWSVSDVRGIQGLPRLVVGGAPAVFQPQLPPVPELVHLGSIVQAALPAPAQQAWLAGQPLPYGMSFVLVGQERLGVVPIADDTSAELSSTWPHPAFGGQFLANQRTVTDQGFQAAWAVSSLAGSARGQLQAAMAADAGTAGAAMAGLQTFDVSLVEPLNVYALTGRAIKYGLLFVALTLLAAFMFELFARLRLHPVQYGLVGLSIALFFLLLLALSEKVAFELAYAGAASASVLLLVVYFSAVLRGWRRGFGLGTYVAVLYAALYGLLVSEDNALLLGALLLFGLLALLMLGTRRVDWYALTARGEPAPASA